MRAHALLPLLLLTLLTACGTLTYDLSSVPIPVSAQPADPRAATVEPFTLEAKSVLWIHGLLGADQPDIATLLTDTSRGHDRITGLRIHHAAGFHDWLLTHVTATLIRIKTVTIEGQLVRDR